MCSDRIAPTRALISVSDKTGVVEFGRALAQRGVEILSTGGTAKRLAEAGVAVVEVADYTGFAEMMAGRVKTLHPLIHGGLLGRRGADDAVMSERGVGRIDLLVVNLYPFEQTVARADCDLAQAIENIDIGGPAMLRSAAKNYDAVTTLIDAADYRRALAEIDAGGVTAATRFDLAVKTFEHVARYDAAIANYLGAAGSGAAGSGAAAADAGDASAADFPRTYTRQYRLGQIMRYGENPHQKAAFYHDIDPAVGSLAAARQLGGKTLSYNNIADADAALSCVREFDAPACVIVKHANPCGVALGADPLEAYRRAFRTDPTSAFGGIIAFNRELDADAVGAILEQQFVEVIVAPKIRDAALRALAAKPNVRVLQTGDPDGPEPGWDYRRVGGGLLVQQRDLGRVDAAQLRVVSRRRPSDDELEDLLFAWRVAKFVKSNAIVYARERMTIGVGAGQMSRVYSARIASIKAADEGLEVSGSVLASDAFFPFRDGLDAAAAVGVRAVVQPGGSVRDDEVIAAADEHDIAMAFTGVRHFRH